MKRYNYALNLRVLYILLIISCIVIITLSFVSWNKEKLFKEDYKNSANTSLKYNIDSCSINKNSLSIKGWIFNDTYPQNGNLIITAKLNSKEIIIPLFTFVRDDVAQAFSRDIDFDNVGFNASISRHLIGRTKITEFNFYIVDNNNNISKVLNYECK